MTWKLYALLSGGAFVATYLVSGPRPLTPVPPQSPAARTAPAPQVGNAETEIQELAAHLEARVQGDVRYRPPTRNPFEFASARRAESKQVIAPKPADTTLPFVAPPPRPPIRLSGIATDHVDGMPQHTAILSTPAGVVFVHEGESIGTYRVKTITDDTLTVESVGEGTPFTFSLSRP